MTGLNLGSHQLPINAATKSFAILAKRGAGKTYTGGVIAEEFFKNNIPFIVFDPIDVWWGLRLAADGRSKGLPVVVFGLEHADIQIDRDMGRRIAQAVVSKNISCVISTFGMPKVAQRHLIAEFADEILNINNTPRHIFIEEAHEYIPQKVFGEMSKVFNAVSNLIVMGRNRGLGVTILNQRAATVNKDVLTQIDTLLAFRNIAPQDRKALREWVEFHAAEGDFEAFMKSLPSLPTGEGWMWSPEFLGTFDRIKIRPRETFHPDREKIGDKFVMPALEQVDIQSFIDEFQSQVSKPVKEVIKEKAAKDVFKESMQHAEFTKQLLSVKNDYESKLMQKDIEIRTLEELIAKVRAIVGADSTAMPMTNPRDKNEALIESLPNYEKDIMRAIKQHPNIPFSRHQLAIKSGKSYDSSTYASALSRLLKLNLLEKQGGDFVYRA